MAAEEREGLVAQRGPDPIPPAKMAITCWPPTSWNDYRAVQWWQTVAAGSNSLPQRETAGRMRTGWLLSGIYLQQSRGEATATSGASGGKDGGGFIGTKPAGCCLEAEVILL